MSIALKKLSFGTHGSCENLIPIPVSPVIEIYTNNNTHWEKGEGRILKPYNFTTLSISTSEQ